MVTKEKFERRRAKKVASLKIILDRAVSVPAAAKSIGLTFRESLISEYSPHWRFLSGHCDILHYWPATQRWWSPVHNEKGVCAPENLIDFLKAELHDRSSCDEKAKARVQEVLWS